MASWDPKIFGWVPRDSSKACGYAGERGKSQGNGRGTQGQTARIRVERSAGFELRAAKDGEGEPAAARGDPKPSGTVRPSPDLPRRSKERQKSAKRHRMLEPVRLCSLAKSCWSKRHCGGSAGALAYPATFTAN